MTNDTERRKALTRLILETLGRIAPELDPSTLDPDLAFRDQFELDSVDFLNFVIGLEKALDRRIPEADFPRLSSLNGCLGYLDQHGVSA
jgi:acyl carrier protein